MRFAVADLIFRFRALLGPSLAGKLMDGFYCQSLWIAAPAVLFVSVRPTGPPPTASRAGNGDTFTTN